MARANGGKTYSFGMQEKIWDQINRLAADIARDVGDPTMKYGAMVARAAQYLLVVSREEAVAIVKAGRDYESGPMVPHAGKAPSGVAPRRSVIMPAVRGAKGGKGRGIKPDLQRTSSGV